MPSLLNLISKVCVCVFTWEPPHSKYAVSSLTDPNIDESEYSLKTVLSDRLTMFARIVDVSY